MNSNRLFSVHSEVMHGFEVHGSVPDMSVKLEVNVRKYVHEELLVMDSKNIIKV
jgi:hypothetical protein